MRGVVRSGVRTRVAERGRLRGQPVPRDFIELLGWKIPMNTELEYSVNAFGKAFKVDLLGKLLVEGSSRRRDQSRERVVTPQSEPDSRT